MIFCLFKSTLNTHSVQVLSVRIFVLYFMTGEVTDSEASESYSSALSQEEFNDGYDENLMGDEEDQARLAQMTEKEREQEIFKRIEQREVMKTRYGLKKSSDGMKSSLSLVQQTLPDGAKAVSFDSLIAGVARMVVI